MERPHLPDIDEPSANANTLFSWLEQQPEAQFQELAEALFVQLLANAAKSRVSSVNACAKLCGFVQHCATRAPDAVTEWAFRSATALRLFHFYIEWNEKDQHRSLKLVLDLVALLILQNPDEATRTALRNEILQTLVTIISRKSTRPLVKSSIGSLHYLLGKGVYDYEEVARAYGREVGDDDDIPTEPSLDTWRRLVADMFAWMTLHYVCPVAGKFLVAVFAYLQTTATFHEDGGSALFPEFSVEMWLQWLRNSLEVHPTILEDVKLYFFISFFKTDRTRSLQLLEILNKNEVSTATEKENNDTVGAVLQLAALEVGKKAGLVDDPGLNLTGKVAKGGVIVLNESALAGVLARAPTDVRSLALSLLVSSQSTTKPYSSTAFDLLQRYLPTYHAESDAKFRYELLAHTRDMALRLKSAIATMQRWGRGGKGDPSGQSKSSLKKMEAVKIDDATIQKTLTEHEAFLTWYLTFLRAEMAPTASYQRHFTSLKATSWLLRQRRDVSGGVSDILDMALVRRLFDDNAWVRCVLDLIMDPFDDVRDVATSLLVLAPPELVAAERGSLRDVLANFSRRADHRASQTARQDHADGAARCQGLMCSWAFNDLEAQKAILSQVLDVLETKIERAETDLASAAIRGSVHGEFASIRFIWAVLAKAKYSDADLATLVEVQARIVKSCERVWHVVKHVLCDDSPEGHIPDDLEDQGISNLDSKDLLSFSFRSINESSNTMRAIVSHIRFSRVKGTLTPSRAVFERIGNLAFEQLSTLRHRGALTTVAQTFTMCCQLAQDPSVTVPGTAEDATLVATWYKGTLNCIRTQISTTRRSAGIPALFSGILASSSTSQPAFFDAAIRTACSIAQQPANSAERAADGSRLPQVHAFNCLRDVFRSSLLSKRAERLLPECLQLAANSLRSDVWAIRNCGLLLLRSLIDCLFGTGESKASLESGWDGRTIRISYNKYPTLPGVLLSLLRTDKALSDEAVSSSSGHLQIESQQAAAESVFPALDIIRRAGPPETHRAELYEAVVHYLGSHLWHVREMAARTVCSFLVNNDNWAAGVQQLLLDKSAMTSVNRWHGSLLAVRFILVRVAGISGASVTGSLRPLLSVLDTLAAANGRFTTCPEVRAAYLEARNTIASLALQFNVSVGEAISKTVAAPADNVAVPSALLKAQTILQVNYTAVELDDRHMLENLVASVAVSDPDNATRLLETVQASWFGAAKQTPDTASWLTTVYVSVSLEVAAAAEVRAVALLNLAEVMDYLLFGDGRGNDNLLPAIDSLVYVWSATSQGAINPTLSWAVLRASGPILAASVRAKDRPSTSLLSVSAWVAMIKAAIDPAQTFDTRMAATEALRSFALATAAPFAAVANDNDLLLFVSCVYDTLNDDDDEIRDVAAEAAGAVLETPLIPGEAARRLPMWLASRFGASVGFVKQAAARMEGHSSTFEVTLWPSAATLLEEALEFDDALFLVEEHNLYVDEVREAKRWAAVIAGNTEGDGIGSLTGWLANGLEALVSHVRGPDGDDGPLGWTAAPGVFAVCARLILGTRAVLAHQIEATDTNLQRLSTLLTTFQEAGEKAHVHGLLLAMAKEKVAM
ncbi:hypothetical protein HMPREF1624_04276 [Sporothrix schenckii ATCC 58251]|uniref:Uncharacterized protein n=1 Tax=Sporothrix schenckii (strain ATCC 58251 / de Perez 2211183) TaxID=1391915 RepID=U7PVY0_SPOS1|nr:hypothetical protein HMPREF1624_04276 [Sporothrix schenckii ATCC 58251]